MRDDTPNHYARHDSIDDRTSTLDFGGSHIPERAGMKPVQRKFSAAFIGLYGELVKFTAHLLCTP